MDEYYKVKELHGIKNSCCFYCQILAPVVSASAHFEFFFFSEGTPEFHQSRP